MPISDEENSNCDATIIDFRASIYGSLSPSAILPDGEAQFTIKKGSRKSYIKAFDSLREYVGNDLEARPPTEQELLDYFNYLRLVKGLKSGSLWTTYSKINGLCKAKYSLNLKAFCRVTSLIRSYDIDVQFKSKAFSSEDIKRFIFDESLSCPYWLVRKVVVCVAFFGGLSLVEVVNLCVENCDSSAQGVYVTYKRSKRGSEEESARLG